jgi:nitroreductase
MEYLGLSADEVLTTTRAVRKRLDLSRPIEMSVVKECLEQAMQAPIGGNAPRIRFLVVTDRGKRHALAGLYRRFYESYRSETPKAHKANPAIDRLWGSTDYLAEHFHEVPVLVIPCWPRSNIISKMPAHSPGSSVYPAAWSYMLAARERGLGTCMTTGHLVYEREAADLLRIPYDSIAQFCLIPTAYTIGTEFKPTKRPPIDEFICLDEWCD